MGELCGLYLALHDLSRSFSYIPLITWNNAHLIRAFLGVKSASSLSSMTFLFFLVLRAKSSILILLFKSTK